MSILRKLLKIWIRLLGFFLDCRYSLLFLLFWAVFVASLALFTFAAGEILSVKPLPCKQVAR
jgi:hypothetical protein